MNIEEMNDRAYGVGERFEFKNGYKYGNLNISNVTKICFSHGIINKQNKALFPKDAKYVEAYLTIDAEDCSDPDICLGIDIYPVNDNGEMKEHMRRFNLGYYSRAEVKELFTKAAASL